MSKHSKHGRGKHSHFRRSQRHQQMQMNAGMTQPGTVFSQPNADTIQPSTGMMQPTPSSTPMKTKPVVAPQAQQMPMQKRQTSSGALPLHYEFIAGDLRTIGILTAIVIVVLVVLSIFLK
jgi:hypothetical protein